MEALAHAQDFSAQLHYVVDDDSKVGEARRAAQAITNFEFDELTAGRAAIVATELANNLLRHAGGGELLVQKIGVGDETIVELLAIDRGPGMGSVELCMRDGYSTAGTPGTGFGAVRRLSDDFDIYSVPGEGTVVMARFGKGQACRYGAVCVPMPGEYDCGDAWHLVHNGADTAVIVVDGLGHGTFAAQASQAAIASFAASPFLPPHEVMSLASTAMSKTRGGAAACALLKAESVSYSGIGNISASLVSREKSQGLVSHAGTMGMPGRRPQQFEYSRQPGSLLIMHSDGVSARWSLRDRPDLFAHHPSIVASVLYRDHGRNRDDATVVVIAS